MQEYEAGRLLANLSYNNWITTELFSFNWFLLVGITVVAYGIWLKLLDRKNIVPILLHGSLCTVGFIMAYILLDSFWGFWHYKTTIFPLEPYILGAISVAPVVYMLALQCTSSWRNYMIWSGIGTAVLAFGILPLFVHLGILQFFKGWNYFYHFFVMLTGGTISRNLVLWFIKIEQEQPAAGREIRPFYHKLQPAANKLINDDENEKK